MNTRSFFLLLIGSSLLTISYTQAASGKWDTDAAGNWTTVTNWVGDTAYATGVDAIATLGNVITANRIITLDSDITIGGINAWDNSNSYTISGASVLTLDVSTGAPVIDVYRSNLNLTISSQVTGSDGLTKIGAGALILSSNSTNYAGTTTINAGTLQIGTGSAGSLNGTTGTALTFTGTGTFNVREAANSNQGMGLLTLISGDATIQSTYQGTGNTTLTFSNVATRTAGATANFVTSGGTNGTTNKIVLTQFGGATTPTGAVLDQGIFYNGSSYAVYDSGGFVRGLVYGTDTDANASLSGTAVETLGTIGATKHAQFVGAATTTTTASAQATGLTTLTVANGAAFRVGQAISGTGITANTFVTGISGNVLTLSQAAGVIAASAVVTPYNSVYAQTTGSLNTLNLSGAGASLTLASGQTLSVNGILRSAGTAGVVGAISGGTGIQTVISGGEMVIRTDVANDTLDIRSAILDNGGSSLTKTGLGTLILSGANTYTGATTVNAGTLTLSSANANTSGFVINGGNLGGAAATTAMTTTTLADKNITVNGTGTLNGTAVTTNGGITLNDGSRFNLFVNGTNTFNGAITGAGILSVGFYSSNNTTINLDSLDNTFTGGIEYGMGGNTTFTLNLKSLVDTSTYGEGNIRFGIGTSSGGQSFNLASGYKTGGLTLNNRQFQFESDISGKLGNNSSEQFTINSDLFVNGATGAPTLTLGGTGTGTSTFAGVIGNGSSTGLKLTKADSGTWILSGANSYTGVTTVSGGVLAFGGNANVASANPLGQSSADAANLLLADGTTLRYIGAAASTDRLFKLSSNANNQGVTLDASGSGAINFTNTGSIAYGTENSIKYRNLTLTGTNTGDNTLAALIADNGVSEVRIIKTGTGTWVLSGANTYTGNTTVSGGTLQFAKQTSLYNNTADYWIKTKITVNSGGTLAFNVGGTGEFTNSDVTTLLGNLAVSINNNGLRSGSSIGFDTTNASGGTFTIGDAIADSTGTGGGAIGLTKQGTGTLVLTNTNTYTGPTTVSKGTLQFATQGSLYNNNTGSWTAANLRVASGATLAFNVGGTGEFKTENVTTLLTNLAASSSSTNGMNAGSSLGFDTTNAGGTFTIADVIADTTGDAGGARGLTKLGTGTLELTNPNTYSGVTTITGGTLLISGSGAINQTSGVTIGSGATFRYNSSEAYTGGAIANNGGTIGGTGTIAATVTLDSTSDILAPGNSPGIQEYTVNQSWNSFTYEWEINDFTGTTAGSDFDQIQFLDGATLTLTGASIGSYVLDVLSLTAGNATGAVPNFSEVDRSWNILTTTGGISGFNASYWTIDTGGFTSNPAWQGDWSLDQVGNNLVLTYTAMIPEPSTAILAGLGLAGLTLRRRRR